MRRGSLCERAGKAELFRPFFVFSFALFTANRSKPQSFAAAFAAGRGACPAVKDLCSRKKTKIGREVSAKFSRRSKGGETVLRCMRAAGERGGRLTPSSPLREGSNFGPGSCMDRKVLPQNKKEGKAGLSLPFCIPLFGRIFSSIFSFRNRRRSSASFPADGPRRGSGGRSVRRQGRRRP